MTPLSPVGQQTNESCLKENQTPTTQATRIGTAIPAMIQEPMQGSTVSIANRIEEAGDEALRPCFAMSGAAALSECASTSVVVSVS